MTHKISREYWFSAAHRLEGHPKCGRLHGHNYKVVVELEGPVGAKGMLVDYGHLDAIVKPLINLFDHRYIVSKENIDAQCPYIKAATEHEHGIMLSVPASTAECLTYVLYKELSRRLHAAQIKATYLTVTIHETPKSMASYGGPLIA